jgi:hypothetical protein
VLSTDYDFYMFFIEGHGTPVTKPFISSLTLWW